MRIFPRGRLAAAAAPVSFDAGFAVPELCTGVLGAGDGGVWGLGLEV